MSIDYGKDAANLVAQLSVEMGIESVKVTGKLASLMLKLILEKVKDGQKYAAGLVELDKLIKTDEPLTTFKLKNEMVDQFKDKADKFKLMYSIIPNEKDSTVIFKTSQVEFVNEIAKDLIEKSEVGKSSKSFEYSNEEILKIINEFIDIPEINEKENLYRHEVKDLEINKAKPINDILTIAGLDTQISISDLNKDDRNLATIQFKSPIEYKENTIGLVEKLKEKSLAELKSIIKELNKDVDIKKSTKEKTHVNMKNYVATEKKNINDSTREIMKKIDDLLKNDKKTLDGVIEKANKDAHEINKSLSNSNKIPKKKKEKEVQKE